ncbi:hypothetical protein VTN00DRAFT_1214 [Thermoascus crustaceus]|uniref:uncharacterized protein n=1 Tax=Thermoascus crustaceus TaxID=5088 RepID=UPI00374250F7
MQGTAVVKAAAALLPLSHISCLHKVAHELTTCVLATTPGSHNYSVLGYSDFRFINSETTWRALTRPTRGSKETQEETVPRKSSS